MPRSLSSRLLIAFTFVIVLSLAISAVGTLLLLRDRQQDAAEERVGRLAEPLTLAVALLEEAGAVNVEIQNAVADYAESFDVRVLLVDDQGRVVLDTDSRLIGEAVEAFRKPGLPITTRGDVEFRMVHYDGGGDDLLLFAPAYESLRLTPNRLIQLQTVIYGIYTEETPPEVLENIAANLLEDATERTIPLPTLRPLIAVPEGEVTSAWQDLLPQLAIAGGIALVASALAAAFISRSVSGRLGRVTQAAQEMAVGNYDQRLDVRGEDEVGRLAKAFNVMARQVSNSHQMMRDLLANVSHELKTPLTSIQGFSQAMEDGAITSQDEYQEAGRIINEETQRMHQLVDDLIDLSRLESGQAVVEREPLDVAEVLRNCARRFEWQLRESGAEMHLDLDALPSIRGDVRRLEQAFSNLIDNAARHTPSGGAITVRAESENGLVRVAIHNTGSFIPEEELPRVFERFFQHDRARGGVGGAGLGLAIVSEVVQAHNGDVRAESDPDTGTQFVVTLPAGGGTKG